MKILSQANLKITAIACVFLFSCTLLQAQIKVIDDNSVIVGPNNQPEPSAKFEVKSETQGFLAPRMSITQRNNITNPADGLLVYVIDLSDTIRGFYYYDGIQEKWLRMYSGCTTP